jgi:hypothetical protein
VTHRKQRDVIIRQRLLVLGTLAMVLGGMLFTASEALSFGTGMFRPELVYAVSGTLVLSGVSLLLLHYLRASSLTDLEVRLSRQELSEQRRALLELQDVISLITAQTQIAERASASVWTDAEREKIVATLSDSVTSTLSNAFLKSVEERYGAAIVSRISQSELRDISDESKRRIRAEIDALTRRSNINLIIGVITTLLAVGLLAYIVLSDTLSSTNLGTVLLHFLPRLSIVIFIETFSFFFLRLYKSGLADIKYYQNELTGIEARQVALQAAIGANVPDYAQPILTEFAKTDRNGATSSSLPQKADGSANIKDLEGLVGKIADLAGKVSS